MIPTTVSDVAKTKAKAKAPEPERKPMVVQVRGSASYKAWAERVAQKDGSTLAALYDRAVREYARKIGVAEDPPAR